MRHMGTVATKRFNAIQDEIKRINDTFLNDNTITNEEYVDKYMPELEKLMEKRDKYL